MITLILLGAPGAGKGTQATRISQRYGIPAISTGAIFRSNITEKTPLGQRAQSYMDRGELVPDTVTTPMVKARLGAPDTANGFLLDGYPRTLPQAHALRDMLADIGRDLDVVIEIKVGDESVVERMLQRASEEHRADDTEPIMRRRLHTYHELTEPMATYYADQDLLEVIDGHGSVDEVSERIFHILDTIQASRDDMLVTSSASTANTCDANGYGSCCCNNNGKEDA